MNKTEKAVCVIAALGFFALVAFAAVAKVAQAIVWMKWAFS